MDSKLTKSELRRSLRRLRRSLAAAQPQAGALAAARLPLERLPAFSIFAAYVAQGGEIDAGPLLARLSACGARACLPVAGAGEGTLLFRAYRPGAPLVRDGVGVPAPPASELLLEPDLVIVPLLAFDRRGGRLGQGGGHYDRTLAALRARRPVFALGLAHAGQEVDELPGEPHDQRLDAILTETGYIEVE